MAGVIANDMEWYTAVDCHRMAQHTQRVCGPARPRLHCRQRRVLVHDRSIRVLESMARKNLDEEIAARGRGRLHGLVLERPLVLPNESRKLALHRCLEYYPVGLRVYRYTV